MKKIITLLLLSFLLFSCSNQENNNKKDEIKTKENIEKDIKKGSDLQENTKTKNEEKELKKETEKIDKKTEVVKEKIKEKAIREIKKHDDWNIYLYENWKKIDYLTEIAGKIKKEEKFENWFIWNKEKFPHWTIEYSILNAKWKYGIVDKWYNSNEWIWFNKYYVINLNNNQKSYRMEGIWFFNSGSFYKVEWDNLLLKIDDSFVFNTTNDFRDCYTECNLKSDIIKEWYKKQWNIWVKSIDLSKIAPDISDKNISKKKVKKSVNKNHNNNTIKTWKYSHNNLIKEWYKLNTIWDINEYYKIVYHDEVREKQSDWTYITLYRWYSENKTIYIKWNKILDFSSLLNWWSFINIYYPQIDKRGANSRDIWNLSFDAVQPIFWNVRDKIIITDIDTIKLISKEKWINKIIWKRWKWFLD